MKRTLALFALLSFPWMASAQSAPVAVQHGPDLQFSCGSADGSVRSCHPVHAHYKRYMRLANWRFVGSASAAGSCVHGRTYGYGKHAVWVSGDCVGVFQAPDLRYGDAYNAQRLAEAQAGAIVVMPPAFPGPVW